MHKPDPFRVHAIPSRQTSHDFRSRIDGIEARMLFQGKSMEVTAKRGMIYGVVLSPVKAVIPDLIPYEVSLLVEGQANGPAQNFVRYAQSSPVGEHLRGFATNLGAKGVMRLGLNMQIPLQHSVDTTVSGKLTLPGNSLVWSGVPPLEQVQGSIDFTSAGVAAKNIGAQFLGGPLRVDVGTRAGRVQILAQGQATAEGLAPWMGEAGKHVGGQTAWRGQIDLAPEGEHVRIESDLVGLGSSLPAPLAKAATQALPLWVTSQPQADGHLNEVRLGKTVGAMWRSTADGQIARGGIRFGGQAVLPGEPGLRLAGSGRGLDLSGWMALLPESEDDTSMSLSRRGSSRCSARII